MHLASGLNAYDFVLIDCPPSLGHLTQAALASSTEVLMPIQCEYFAMEGLAQMMGTFLKQEFQRNWLSKVAAAIAWPVLSRFKQRIDHRRYNGASLLGLRGIVIKSHGSADKFAFQFALDRATEECRRSVLRRITEQMAIEHPQEAA